MDFLIEKITKVLRFLGTFFHIYIAEKNGVML